ncbi:MAG: ligand-binding sensor domain-containing protein [Acutalibacteraceae bacterium]
MHTCLNIKPFLQRTRSFYSSSDGLPCDEITCCGFDSDGNLFAGTQAGLAVFDGNSFCSFQHEGLKEETTFLFRDKDGILWAGADCTVYAIKKRKVIFSQSFPKSVLDMDSDGAGNLWLLTNNILYIKGEKEFEVYTKISEGYAHSFCAYGDKKIYVANPIAIMGLFGKRPRWGPIVPDVSDMPTNCVQAMAADKFGHIWIGTDEGVCIYDSYSTWLTAKEVTILPKCDIKKILLARDGTRYIGTDIGLYIISGVKTSFLGPKRWLPASEVTAIAVKDDNSEIWVGTEKGLSRISQRMFTLKQKADHYQQMTEKYHVRDVGYVTIRSLDKYGDITSGQVEVSDNDGLWTGSYLASQALRYAVTKSPEALEIARRSAKALIKLVEITGVEGFPARAYRRKGEHRFGEEHPEWHRVEDEFGVLEWKGETSSDETTGHFYGLSLFYDLCANKKEKKEVAANLSKIVTHILDHDYALCDIDNLPTTWARWGPHELNRDNKFYWEKCVNSLELLSMLKIVHHMTGEKRFDDEYRKLIEREHYALNCMQYKIPDANVNHIDDNLSFLSIVPLLRYEDDPQLRTYYLNGLRHCYEIQRSERCPLWNVMYGALSGDMCDIENAVLSMQELPLDLIHWEVKNSVRPDLKWDKGQEIFGGKKQLKTPLPYDEKPITKYDANPYVPDGGNGLCAEDGTVFLHPYWFARYYGLISED